MATETRSPNSTSFDESNPFSSNGSTLNGIHTIIEEKIEVSPSFSPPYTTNKRTHHRRNSSFSKSYQDLESLEFSHLQDQCRSGSNYTASLIRLLGKLCDGYEKFGKTLIQSIETETNFISKYTSNLCPNSPFQISHKLLRQFSTDLAINLQQTGMEIKTKMIAPLIEFQKQCDSKYQSIYRKHEHSHNKYKSDTHNLSQFRAKYEHQIADEKNKFKLIQLLSSHIMPPNDHKTLKKSWHSPSKFNQSVSKFIEKARTKTRKVSINLGNKSGQKLVEESDEKHLSDTHLIEDNYERFTKEEIDRNNEDKKEHLPLLYAMYRYSNARNKLVASEETYMTNIENVNHGMTQYTYVRKETMKAMKKLEIARLNQSKTVYVQLCEVFGSDKYQINAKESFLTFRDSTEKLNAKTAFDLLVQSSESTYAKPAKLESDSLLIGWRSPYHLFEDLMFKQTKHKHINKNSLHIPFVFEYLMEHIESHSAINDPDIFMLNAISPKESNVDHSFSFDRRLSPDGVQSNRHGVTSIKTTDINAIPILTAQINELYQCKPVAISDHHHSIILLKLWLYKCSEPIIPYYLYDRVCLFQFQNSVEQRLSFVKDEILSKLSDVRVYCLARLVSICKKIVAQQNQITIIDLSYELSNVIIRNPKVEQWRQLHSDNDEDNIDDRRRLKLLLDPQNTYQLPLSPSHKTKRAEMAFITYILSNDVPELNDKKIVNYGPKLTTLQSEE